jgi:CHASE2 domain-containing sensor protein
MWLLAPLAAVLVLSLVRPHFLAAAERATYDALVRGDRAHHADGRVVIVDIDERSLSAVGQWPWRREVLGTLVARTRSLGASAVALDVLLAERERTDSSGASTDDALTGVVRGGRVAVGYAMTFEPGSPAPPNCPRPPFNIALSSDDENLDPFFHAKGAVCSLSPLMTAAAASGFLNAAPDADGILRRVPVLLQYQGRIYPSLALAAVTAATHASHDILRIANANTVSLSLGDRWIPLDGKSHILVRYRGVKRTFPYVSAVDVLQGKTDHAAFAGKIVFIGTTALGTREVVATPLDTLFAAVEVQATVADNLLRGDVLRRPEHAIGIETASVIVAGGLAVLLISGLGLIAGSASAVACALAAWLASAALFSAYGIFLSPLFAMLSVGAVLSSEAAVRLVFEYRRADDAVADKAATRRMMIQSLLSLTETRDYETGQHSRRTQRNMRLLAEELAKSPSYRAHLTADTIELLSALAPLHDIGKVGVPDRVLGKPGALTVEEFSEIRQHPALGREVIARVQAELSARDDHDGVLALAKDIVYTHHERWDGTGYPQGLRGEDIPVAGRLMAVVDAYDAMVMHRRYQSPLPHDEAVRRILKGRGTLFEPGVVDAFERISPQLGA